MWLVELLIKGLVLRYWWQTLVVLVLVVVGRAVVRGYREERARRKLLTRLAGHLRRTVHSRGLAERGDP